MSRIQQIKQWQAQGWSLSAIAAQLGVDRKTVRKYVEQQDFSPQIPVQRRRRGKLDPYQATIDRWLDEDQHQWYKQRHTAQRIFDRLEEEFPDRAVSYRTVCRYIQTRHRPVPVTGTLELIWHPGEAQVDFGQADIIEQGHVVRIHYLCLTFPYSNAGYVQLFRGENAECVTQGLTDLFTHIGGAPRRVVFDNATGVGRRLGEVIRLTRLFAQFQAHYGLETTFCNPYAGHEKGNVENKVGYFRRNLLVPVPVVDNLLAQNQDLLGQSEHHWTRLHYKKSVPIRDLFQTDREALRALPPQAFAPYRYTQVRTDQQGRFCLEGQHWYSSAPEYARHTLIVRVGAHSVEPLAANGCRVTGHHRIYGPQRSDSTDYRTSVHRIADNPGAWRNSPLRSGLPESVRGVLDTAMRADLQAALQGLAQCTETWGFDHAVRALEEAAQVGRMKTDDIIALAQRMALAPAELVGSTTDLRSFDVFLTGRTSS